MEGAPGDAMEPARCRRYGCSYSSNARAGELSSPSFLPLFFRWSVKPSSRLTGCSQAYTTGNPSQQDMQMDVQDLSSRKHSRSWDLAHGMTPNRVFGSPLLTSRHPGQGDLEVSSNMYFSMHGKP
jgi:hypothetical protein